MSRSTGNAPQSLWLVIAIGVLPSAHAADRASVAMRPSDCRPRDADSTCATAVAGASRAPSPDPFGGRDLLYDGPLGGVPAAGYAYWGWDFVASETGVASPVRPDVFVNRSNVPVTIKLSFNFPTNHPCRVDCLPGVQFQVDAGWFKLDPPFVIDGNVASVSEVFTPGRGYGWVIGLWQGTNTRLTVTVPSGSATTLEQVGLATSPAAAQLVLPVIALCDCGDGTQATCSDGSRYSNGLLGQWTRTNEFYERAGAFSNCQSQR